MKYSTLKYASFVLTEKGIKVLRESDRYADTDKRGSFGGIAREILAEADRAEAAGESGRVSKVIEALLADPTYAPAAKAYNLSKGATRNTRIKFINDYVNSVAGESGEGLITVPE